MFKGLISITACSFLTLSATAVAAGDSATAVVQIIAHPPISAGTFRFSGTPAGELRVEPDHDKLMASDLAAGAYESTLEEIDPDVFAAGYRLVEIRCDDPASHGDVDRHTASFDLASGKTVTCAFMLAMPSACICPKEGTWTVNNLPGQMACSGAMTMTLPLAPNAGSGTLELKDDCDTIVAAGFSEDEAPLVMHRNDSCGYQGSVGGTYEEVPMRIDFTWVVQSDKVIVGDLHSEVSEQGMTCVMSRDYEIEFSE